ncbi:MULTISPECIES: response regulator [Burkholderia]|uniref:response regulator n=1 Tax=Burkholderia TaxID=32008 RepID=UPI0008A20DC0|nr:MULTISPECIES: response regulator [Burkholderia]MBJ9681100.1 response regulator [Burkholderia multivorans]MDR8918748.1 Polar-differentiation response regulator DivK [Burkholderia multivorans]MDR8924134.1 Polar-differentiation response regulator DivK [Burkholderia multivorans]MDR8969400.1 Polar-differentiation response regulator DivK [Burkholderia multivorans]MDR8992160.1 Polar-differentiation response regulator DivK [Burkholderia multivorans]
MPIAPGDDPAADDVLLWRSPDSVPRRPRRVLVVDDYRDAADALQLLLDARGFECRVVDDPFAVCDVARDWQPFAIVLDIAMPRLDGLQLARRLRGDPRTADMLLVACSAFASPVDRERAREAGFDAHCAKPLTPHPLLRYLEAVCGARPAQRLDGAERVDGAGRADGAERADGLDGADGAVTRGL